MCDGFWEMVLVLGFEPLVILYLYTIGMALTMTVVFQLDIGLSHDMVYWL
jgi:hypothetical protein